MKMMPVISSLVSVPILVLAVLIDTAFGPSAAASGPIRPNEYPDPEDAIHFNKLSTVGEVIAETDEELRDWRAGSE